MNKFILSNIASFSQGKQIPMEEQIDEYKDGLNRFIRIIDYTNSNIRARYTTENDDRYKVSKDDLVMIRYGSQTAGKVVRGFEGIIANNMFKINLHEPQNFDSNFLYFYLSSNYIYDFLMRAQVSSTMPAITFDMLSDVVLNIPDLSKQIKIGAILNSLEEKLILNNKINTELESMARTIYDYWFVQFDFPDKNGRPYKSSGGEMVFNKTLNREIPKDWSVDNFNTIARIDSGFPFKSDLYEKNGKYKIITIKNVNDGNIDSDSTDTISLKPNNLPNNCILKPRDILISLTGNVGRIGAVYENNLLLNQRVGKFVCNDKIDLLYSYYLMSSRELKTKLEMISGGSSQANLSPIQAVDFIVAIPPKNIREKFFEMVSLIFDKQIFIKQESKKLIEIRDFILPMLMNGQVLVTDN